MPKAPDGTEYTKREKRTRGKGRATIVFESKRVQKLAAQGLSREQIALVFGVSYASIYNNKKRMALFQEDYAIGQAQGLEKISNALYDKAMDGNVPAQKFFLASRDRDRWQENPKNPIGDVQRPVVEVNMIGAPREAEVSGTE